MELHSIRIDTNGKEHKVGGRDDDEKMNEKLFAVCNNLNLFDVHSIQIDSIGNEFRLNSHSTMIHCIVLLDLLQGFLFSAYSHCVCPAQLIAQYSNFSFHLMSLLKANSIEKVFIFMVIESTDTYSCTVNSCCNKLFTVHFVLPALRSEHILCQVHWNQI